MATRKKKASPRKTPKKIQKPLWRRLFRYVFVLFVVGVLAGVGGLVGVFWYYGQDLPRISTRSDFKPSQITRIYSKKGHVLDEVVAPDGRRTLVSFEAIAKPMRDAMLAAEDADFYKHQGLDYVGMIRAFYYALRYDRLQGASTITQQVVKNLILTPERTARRKVQEIILAGRLENHLLKDDILYIYLNLIYFGHGNYGVEEAARFFFGKPAAQLKLHEAALLAGVVQSPERHSPRKHPKRATERRRYVLEQMWKKGFVSEAEARAAMKKPLGIVKSRKEKNPYLKSAPYYTAHIRKLLEEKFPGQDIGAMGLQVKTALDVEKQLIAQESLRAGLREFDKKKGFYLPFQHLSERKIKARIEKAKTKLKGPLKPSTVYLAVVTKVGKKELSLTVGHWSGALEIKKGGRSNPEGQSLSDVFRRGDMVRVMVDRVYPQGSKPVFVFAPGPQGAIVSIDAETRHVEAMVGGYDFAESNFNRATQARRQTGSSFKPVVYGAALMERVATPSSIWLDAPKPYPLADGKTWSPKNSDGKFLGPLTLRTALAKSRNVIAVRLLDKVSIPRAQSFARSLGIRSPLVDNLTMALGSSELTVLEMTNAYSTLASLGKRAEPVFLLSVHDSYGQPLYEHHTEWEEALPEDVSWLTVSLMTSVVSPGGTAGRVGRALKRPAAGKTGTTNKSKDAWFVGFTPQKITGVWVGNDNNTPLGKRSSGGSTAAPIWTSYMKAVHEDLPKADFPRPDVGIVDAMIEENTGLLGTDDHEKTRKEYFLLGSAPTTYAPAEEEKSTDDFLLGGE